MPRTKGSKNKPKVINDYASQIAEKQESITSLTAFFASRVVTSFSAFFKVAFFSFRSAFKVSMLAVMDAISAVREAKKAEAESVVKRLLASGMSADEILERLK